jgi:hypothetical protein
MKYTKQEIIDMIREQHEKDLESLIEFLDRCLEGEPYEYPETEDY